MHLPVSWNPLEGERPESIFPAKVTLDQVVPTSLTVTADQCMSPAEPRIMS